MKVSKLIYDHAYGLFEYDLKMFSTKYKSEETTIEVLKLLYLKFEEIKRNYFKPIFYDREKLYKNTLEYITNFSKSRIKKMVISITEKCNLRCSYCFYGKNYDYSRNHSNKVISYEQLVQAVDNYIKICDFEDSSISFYGGEPLLEFELVKKITNYVKKRNKTIKFGITTNGTLLNEEVVSFLVDNNFRLSVSMDINKEIHDMNRKTINGEKTFELISNNLENIRRKHPKYFKNISLISTVSYNNSYDANLLAEKSMRNWTLTNLNEDDINIREYIIERFRNRRSNVILRESKSITKTINEFIYKFNQKVNNTNYIWEMNYAEKQIMNQLLVIRNRNRNSEILPPKGSCIPVGLLGLMVNTDGNLFSCVKLDHSHNIGNITDWIDEKKSSLIINDFIKFKINNCTLCWAKTICNICFVYFAKNETFKSRPGKCHIEKNSAMNKLMIYSHLLNTYGEEVLVSILDNFHNTGVK